MIIALPYKRREKKTPSDLTNQFDLLLITRADIKATALFLKKKKRSNIAQESWVDFLLYLPYQSGESILVPPSSATSWQGQGEDLGWAHLQGPWEPEKHLARPHSLIQVAHDG